MILITSCQDVVQIELNDMEPVLVIEAVISDSDDPFTLKLSKTAEYFNHPDNPTVSGAEIMLNDESGSMVILEETEAGVYSQEGVYGKANTSYTLNIFSEGIEYDADASIPGKVNIDSLSYYYNPLSLIYEEGFVVNCHFTDPGELENFYRLKAYKISDPTKAKESEDIYDDLLINGNTAEFAWAYEVYEPYDTVVVELYTLDEATYVYYKTLFTISGASEMMSMTTPANPVNNINNGALGFFGAYTISRDTIIIVPIFNF